MIFTFKKPNNPLAQNFAGTPLHMTGSGNKTKQKRNQTFALHVDGVCGWARGEVTTKMPSSSVAMLLLKLGHAVRFFSCNGFIFLLMIRTFVNHH